MFFVEKTCVIPSPVEEPISLQPPFLHGLHMSLGKEEGKAVGPSTGLRVTQVVKPKQACHCETETPAKQSP